MNTSFFRRSARGRRAAAAAIAALLTAASLAAVSLSSTPATAATEVGPTEPGGVVRDNSVNIEIDQVALSYWRSSATGTYAAQNLTGIGLNRGCRGESPTTGSPYTTLTVTAPGGAAILETSSLYRDTSFFALFAGAPALSPQPTPGTAGTNAFRGDITNATIGLEASVDLTGKPAGTYTVTTKHYNMVKTGSGSSAVCSVGLGTGTTSVPGPVTEIDTFEYRPWQADFVDVFGNGEVHANVTPKEFTWSIGSSEAAIYPGTGNRQTFYAFDGTFFLPSDPAACAANPVSCLPSLAIPCDPTTSCIPRLMIISKPGAADTDPNGLVGVFDLETKAFIALAHVDGHRRIMTSLGTVNDAFYHDVLNALADQAAAANIDLMSLLATKVVLRGKGQTSLSLLNGLQVDPGSAPGGIQIVSDMTIQAGVILDIYANLDFSGPACTTQSSSSEDVNDRFTPSIADGYTVKKTDLLPEVPAVGPLGALVGGPVYHITGQFAPGALVNTATAVIGVDTAYGEPNGYPVWISPFVSGAHVTSAKKMDFLGTATWSASETSLGATGCLVVDFMLGTGVAVYNNPLPVSLGALIDLVGSPNAPAAALTAAVDTALTDAAASVTSLPVIDTVLTTILDALPAIP